MLTKAELENLEYLRQEINYLQDKIDNYKPAEIVSDSVRGSSPTFPFVEHTVIIEGVEQKKDRLTEYIEEQKNFKKKLEDEKMRIEKEIENIPFAEIRMIIRHHYIDGLTYLEVMHKMNYNCEETPRLKLKRFLK